MSKVFDAIHAPARCGEPSEPRLRPLRCVFVHAQADSYLDHKFGGKFAGPLFPPLWAYTLASYLPDDGSVSVHVHDTRLRRFAALPPADLFLFTGLNEDLATILGTRDAIGRRYPHAVTAVGGPICASFDRSGDLGRLDAFDHVCIGDGEELIGPLLDRVRSGSRASRILRAEKRFPIEQARPMHREFLRRDAHRYYGALVEVSRGCPFLCEFCDVRIVADNNRPHNKRPEVIVEDLDALSRLGVRQFQLVCDDFIGDPRWAELLLDHILAWEDRTGVRPALYTWATLNLCNYPALMRKMRRAGVDMINVGIESFDRNSLLETAKVQNAPRHRREAAAAGANAPNTATVEAVLEIQSYGIVIAAGLIFGFDSDTERSFDLALDGIRASGVLSGDPHLLTALPGTPLYRRMKLAGRLRDIQSGLGIRYQTNIRYLLPRAVIADGMMSFFRQFADGAYQYARLVEFFRNLDRGNYVPLASGTYLSPWTMLRSLMRRPGIGLDYLARLAVFSRNPRNLLFAAKGVLYVASRRHVSGRLSPLLLWLLMWLNSTVKARGMSAADFDIEDVGGQPTAEHILPPGYAESADELIPMAKIHAQQRYTTGQLLPLIDRLPGRPAAPSGSVPRPQS